MGLSRTIASLEKDAVARNGVISPNSYDDEMAPPPPALSDQNQTFISTSTTGQSPRNTDNTTSTATTTSTIENRQIPQSSSVANNSIVIDKGQFLTNNKKIVSELKQISVNTIPKATDEGQQATDCPSSAAQEMDQRASEIPMAVEEEIIIDQQQNVADLEIPSTSNYCGVPSSQAGPSNSQASSQDDEQLINIAAENDEDLLIAMKSWDFLTEENLQDVMNTLVTEGAGGNGDHLHEIDPNVSGQFELIESPQKNTDEMDQVVLKQKMEEISKEDFDLRRKMHFLMRRMHKLVARSSGLHVSEEVAGFMEHVVRHTKKKEKEPTVAKVASPIQPGIAPPPNLLQSPSTHCTSIDSNLPELIPYQAPPPATPLLEKLTPVSTNQMKSFLKKIANTSAMQNTMLPKRGHSMKYFSKSSAVSPNKYEPIHHGSTPSQGKFEPNFTRSTIPKFEDSVVEQIDQISGLLHSELRLIQKNIDSDATESSSGGESADEMVVYNNPHQQPLAIAKRAAYKYAKDRAAISSRWCWLTTQISDLEYRIRQHKDLHKRLRETKGVVQLENDPQPVNGFRGQLPGASTSTSLPSSSKSSLDSPPNGAFDANCAPGSARTRAFIRAEFKKRKLAQSENLHTISKRAARPSTVKCGCHWPVMPCTLCTGRPDPTAPRDLPDTMPASERVALLDPGFHPVLSFPEDVSHSIHFEAIMNIPEWQSKVMKCSAKAMMKQATLSTKLDKSGGGGSSGNFNDEYQHHVKNSKKNLDSGVPGRKKWSRKGGQLDGAFPEKPIKKRGPIPGKKYGMKKFKKQQLLEMQAAAAASQSTNGYVGFLSEHQQTSNHANQNNVEGSDNCGLTSRSKNASPVPSGGFSNKIDKSSSDVRRVRNYDIDNIVIPYSVAASTRVEILPYKEIPTPKWRIISSDVEEKLLLEEQEKFKKTSQNGQIDKERQENPKESSNSATTSFNFTEDVSDEAIQSKHERALLEERRKFQSFLKFPLTSRSRANRIDSRGNESSGANTPDPTSPAPGADLESIPPSPATCPSTPLDGHELSENSLMQVIDETFNGRKERRRTTSRMVKGDSAAPTRSTSPDMREMEPPYEPLLFPLSDETLNSMKRLMPIEHLQQVEQYFTTSKLTEAELRRYQASQRNQRRNQRRKHNDSLSESKLIKEKIQTTSTIGVNNKTNVLIPLTNHHANVINNAKINNNTTTITVGGSALNDDTVLKKLLNNNHPALAGVEEVATSLTKDINRNGLDIAVGGNLNNLEANSLKKAHMNNNCGEENDDYVNDDNTDSETETGEESSIFVPDEDELDLDDDESIVDDADEDYLPKRGRTSSYKSSATKERKKSLKANYN